MTEGKDSSIGGALGPKSSILTLTLHMCARRFKVKESWFDNFCTKLI